MTVPAGDSEAPLRERKKEQTRKTIHRAALQLAISRGPAQVTIDDIADRAGISPRTFFNYFTSKDEAYVGFTSRAAETIACALRARPAGESITAGVHAVFRDRFTMLVTDVESWRLRRELAAKAPELANAMFGTTARMERAVVDVAVERTGEASMPVVLEAYGAMAAVRSALWTHANAGLKGDLLARLDEAFTALPTPT